MSPRERPPLAPIAAILVLCAAGAYALGVVLAGDRFTRVSGLLPAAVAAVVGAVAALAWARQRTRARRAEQERREIEGRLGDREGELARVREQAEQASEERDEAAQERERAESERREREADAERARAELERAESNRRAEKSHARALRSQLAEMHRRGGPLGDPSNVPELVLRTATNLLEAEKGLLLSRRDNDGDGRLDLLAAEGFDHDPTESPLVRRFAAEVIERDTTVRENEPPSDDGEQTADEHIDNLVAIPVYVRDEFNGIVVCANREGGFHEHDDQALLALGDHAGAVLDSAQLRGELRRAYLSTVAMLAEALEAKDPFLRGHSEEVAHYVHSVAEHFGFEPDRREALLFASLLHDVGKLGISEQLLLKPGPLTDEEQAIISLHPRIGSRIVEQVPALRPMVQAILHHHERFDGNGYPARLKGEQIPIEARIICVADCFSAMTAERPYRGRLKVEEACRELERCAGTQFDPAVVQVFVAAVRSRPPEQARGALAGALTDPEVEGRRGPREPLLGLAELAVTDTLTMLYSHSHFQSVVRAETQRAEVRQAPFAILLFELSGIDELNRREGYGVGDAAIRAVARVVSNAADVSGGTAARHGGRRLGLIVPGADAEAAERIGAQVESEAGGHTPLRWVAAVWNPGDGPDAVADRAWEALRRGPARAGDGRPRSPTASAGPSSSLPAGGPLAG